MQKNKDFCKCISSASDEPATDDGCIAESLFGLRSNLRTAWYTA